MAYGYDEEPTNLIKRRGATTPPTEYVQSAAALRARYGTRKIGGKAGISPQDMTPSAISSRFQAGNPAAAVQPGLTPEPIWRAQFQQQMKPTQMNAAQFAPAMKPVLSGGSGIGSAPSATNYLDQILSEARSFEPVSVPGGINDPAPNSISARLRRNNLGYTKL